jgi:hypothetical protein
MTTCAAIGLRTVYTWAETAQILGVTRQQVRSMVRAGHLHKRHDGMFPFSQPDINEFLTRLNAGRICMGRGRRSAVRLWYYRAT